MKKIVQITTLLLIFAVQFLFAQEPTAKQIPPFPEFTYMSTLQVSEDEYGIAKDYDYIMVSVNKTSVITSSDQWDDDQTIQEWVLEPIRQNKNGNWIYKWKGYSQTACAYYEIPAVWFPKECRWAYGYLTEKLCVGVDYTTFRNNLPAMHINVLPQTNINGQNATEKIRD